MFKHAICHKVGKTMDDLVAYSIHYAGVGHVNYKRAIKYGKRARESLKFQGN